MGLNMKTTSSYNQNCYIREHLKDILLNQFHWKYWVTFTFGYRPDLDEVEDILYNLHYRLDRRLVKHIPQKNSLSVEERTEWFLFPELKLARGTFVVCCFTIRLRGNKLKSS